MGGKTWTNEEDLIVTDVWRSPGVLTAHMHRLPDRTMSAVKKRATVLNLGGRTNFLERKWTAAEDDVIRDGWEKDGALKLLMAKLPGRSLPSLLQRARRIGLGGARGSLRAPKYSWCEQVVVGALSNGESLSAFQLAACTDASYGRIVQVLRRYQGDKFHISGWTRSAVRGCWIARWALGNGDDVPKPHPKSATEAGREFRRRQKLRTGGANPFASLIQQVSA